MKTKLTQSIYQSLHQSLNSVAVLTLAMVLGACSQTKELKEMHDSTGEMSATTKHMDDNMGSMRTDMSGLKSSTKGLCDGSTQALTLQARQGALIQLDNQAVVAADKLAQAVVYVEAFDFQANTLCSTDPDMIDRMLDDAATEFYQVLQRYDVGSDISNPLLASGKAKTKSGKIVGFNALAAAMHRVNRMQVDNKNPKSPTYSILSITEQALLDGEKVDRGQMALTSLKRYELDILANKPLAIKVLQARQNMISAAIVSFARVASAPGVANLLSLAGDRYLSGLTGQVYTWNFDVTKFNVAQLATYTEDLQFVLETRAFLTKLGVTPVMNAKLKALVTGATPTQTPTKGAVTSTALVNAQQTYIRTLVKLKADIQ